MRKHHDSESTKVGRYVPTAPPADVVRNVAALVKAKGLKLACAELGLSDRTVLRIIAEQPTRPFLLSALRSRIDGTPNRAA